MTIVVPPLPTLAEESDIESGYAVRSSTLADLGSMANHLLGRGRCLVPATNIFRGQSGAYVAGTEYVWRFRCMTSAQAIQREWLFTFDDVLAPPYGLGAAATYTIEVPNGGTAVTHTVPAGQHSTLRIVEPLGSQAAADTELTCSISASAVGAGVTLGAGNFYGSAVSVSVYETARPSLLADATDLGVDVAALRPAQPLKSEALTLLTAVAASTSTGRRGGLFHWAVPATAGGATVTTFALANTTTTYDAISYGSITVGIPILARSLYRTGSTGTVKFRPYGWVSVGTATLEVRATTTRSGTTTTAVTTSSTTPTWLTATSFSVDSEDLTTDNGLRGPDVFDYLNIEFRRTGGAGTAYLAGVSVWDE